MAFGRCVKGKKRAVIRQYELVERVRSYDPKVDESLLNRAYVYSMKAHGTQLRASGDPYFSHPLEVAGILTDMKLDSATIATALLHDVVEDTDAKVEELAEMFGPKIAELVDGVTKLSRIEMQTEHARHAENFRKFVLAMSNDIRVLLVKLADRLHNMRTLHYIKKPEKRRRIAMETLEIYAPLAERIGIRDIKEELEELSFQQIEPEVWETVNARLGYLRDEAGTLVDEVVEELVDTMRAEKVPAQVSGREKRPYSIWRKMESTNAPFEQISDVMAFRIVVEDLPTCYRALGIVHGKWSMVPGRFKDYISTPKRNGYQSLHTTVIGPKRTRIEIQIRTREMHEIAELGVAAHWQYKQSAEKVDGSRYRWIRALLEILENASTPEEFLEHTKLEMFNDQVFCFTPKGDLISLPKGSTPVDFAYAVHTEIGNHCVGAKVNGRLLPLRHQLHNGDQVDILTSKGQEPSPRWENFIVTGKARSAIRRAVRQNQREEYEGLGKTILERAFEAEDLDFSERALTSSLLKLKRQTIEDVFFDVGQGHLSAYDVILAAFPGLKLKEDHKRLPPVTRDWSGDWAKERNGASAIPISGLTPGMAVHLSDCCHPLPGDRIVGILTQGQGVMVHTIDCEELSDFSEAPERWLDLAWQTQEDTPAFFAGRLKLIVLNEMGALANIASLVAKQGGNISNLKITERDHEFYTMLVDVEVRNVRHLIEILTSLRASRGVNSADRLRE
ncbi:GTP pyrophosphokinase [Iodidimonas muriae]|uniref:GTP pyrophosphokinase rsh n=1 Tax=Iodidimonas muriae TaxID=261467 RepID=A0ABQ2L5N5_9PROT|nr:GTP pyrophosphokinase [Kordiimonadales bacterium JCM 17843]GGO04461.1 GTP pyrophosphokinase [Iodidimonas muriae]